MFFQGSFLKFTILVKRAGLQLCGFFLCWLGLILELPTAILQTRAGVTPIAIDTIQTSYLIAKLGRFSQNVAIFF